MLVTFILYIWTIFVCLYPHDKAVAWKIVVCIHVITMYTIVFHATFISYEYRHESVRPFFARSAPPLGDGLRKKDTEIPPKRASV
jgi:hypothetical protein